MLFNVCVMESKSSAIIHSVEVWPERITMEFLDSILRTKWAISACYDEFIVRMLVYQYVDNGSLHQWLHGHQGTVSPLTWDNRMKIILGTAKGLVL